MFVCHLAVQSLPHSPGRHDDWYTCLLRFRAEAPCYSLGRTEPHPQPGAPTVAIVIIITLLWTHLVVQYICVDTFELESREMYFLYYFVFFDTAPFLALLQGPPPLLQARPSNPVPPLCPRVRPGPGAPLSSPRSAQGLPG
jgi:hypothetical protein